MGQECHDEATGGDGAIAFVTLDAGLMLGLCERANLAEDASLPAGPPTSTEFSLDARPSRAERPVLAPRIEYLIAAA